MWNDRNRHSRGSESGSTREVAMKGWTTITRNTLLLALALVCIYFALGEVVVWHYWDRSQPLENPVAVKEVKAGALMLADGRLFQLAGIVRKDAVTPEDYDKALSALVSQGVVLTRDMGGGRGFFAAEPK